MRRVLEAATVLFMASAGTTWAAASGELSLVAGYENGDYGTGVDARTQSLTWRYVRGGTIGWRVELPMFRTRSSEALMRAGPGGFPLERRRSGSVSGRGTADGGEAIGDDGWTSGIGDLRLATMRTVVGGGADLFRLNLGVEVKAPLGDEDEGLGTGEWDFRTGLSGEYRFWSVTAFGGAGWNRLGDPSWIELNDVIDAYAGLEGRAFAERITLSGWVDAHGEIVAGAGTAGVVGLELRTNGRFRWRAALTAGLGPVSQDYGVMLGHAFSTGGAGTAYRRIVR